MAAAVVVSTRGVGLVVEALVVMAAAVVVSTRGVGLVVEPALPAAIVCWPLRDGIGPGRADRRGKTVRNRTRSARVLPGLNRHSGVAVQGAAVALVRA
jgi:hypothetical protein